MKPVSAIEQEIQSGVHNDLMASLYGAEATASQTERYQALLAYHKEKFGDVPCCVFSTSGRTELSGNHTDHNQGCVLAGSIQLDTLAVVSLSDDETIILDSMGYPACRIELSSLEPIVEEENTTNALIRGIASRFSEKCRLGGLNISTHSHVKGGSGLSSSAALEVLVGTILNTMFNEEKTSMVEIAMIGQYAENKYFGKPCGLMDQMACAYGGIIEIDFKDQNNPAIVPLQYDFQKDGYHLVIVDTHSGHADLTDEYAAIPIEMKAASSLMGQPVLRGVDMTDWAGNITEVHEKLGDRAVLRSWHYLSENRRVGAQVAALKEGRIDDYLRLVNDSGRSSFCYLQNVSVAGRTKDQPVAVTLAMTEYFLDGAGACRVHGGGFAGTIQAYIPEERYAEYCTFMESVLGRGCVTPLKIRARCSSCIIK